MHSTLSLNNIPFQAIKSGKKKIETRTFIEEYDSPDYRKLQTGDELTFINNETKEELTVRILGVRYYPDVATMFDTEGQENCMSYDATREDAIASYDLLTGYNEGIKNNGIYAIEIKLL